MKKRNLLSVLFLLIVIPALLYVSYRFLNRYYYLSSLAIILIAMFPFFLSFERRKPQAREMAVLATLCALGIAARAAFVWAPSFKPTCGIVMIAGIAFGAESGFLVGAITAFASNFLFGQGSWTPWQMFAFGLAGIIGAVVFRGRKYAHNRWALGIVGFFSILLIIGPVLDTCALFLTPSGQVESVIAIYIAGISVNLVHATAVAALLILAGPALLYKLERIQKKYGMMEGGNAF